jgi:ABC-type spermidine/putrescine transport system permease subunit I
MAEVTEWDARAASAPLGGRRSRTPAIRAWQPEPSAWTGLLMSAPFIVLLAVFVVYPFVRLWQTAFGPPAGLGNLAAYLANSANLYALRTTFLDAGIVTALSFGLGALLAWSLRTTRSRLMRLLLLSAVFVPFWMGSVVKIYAFTVLLGRAGVINTLLINLGLTSEPLPLLYTQPAVVLGMVYQMLPYAVLPMFVAYSSIDMDLILAAESAGATRAQALLQVVLPLAAPGILATLIVNYVIAIGFFLTPVLLGGATAPFTASVIQEDLHTYSNLRDASIGGLLLLVGGVLAIGIGYFLVGKERLRRAISG